MWWDLSGSDPWIVDPNSTYFFGIVVPGNMSVDDVTTLLTAPSPAGVWKVISIHPGHTSGMWRSWEVLGTWRGANPTSITDTDNVAYTGRFLFVADQATPTPANPPTLPNEAVQQEAVTSTYVGGVLAMMALGFGVGYLALR